MTAIHSTQQVAYATVGGFVDELVRSGVRHFCICPGSRSTPLALMVAHHPGARIWMHTDERSASFFGLGMAKLLREPVALVCTSGTAAANFLPALVEAFYARVPLVVLTADRPHELRDWGAPQTIDQVRLYGGHVKWFVDLAEPDASADIQRYTRLVAGRAAALARQVPAGPVHINCPYREPLVPHPGPGPAPWDAAPAGLAAVQVAAGLRAPDDALVGSLTEALTHAQRGLIVCGPQDDPALPAAVARLAEALGFPILADPLSGLRCGPHSRRMVIQSYDAFLRLPEVAEPLTPDLVLRFGAMPVSKPLMQHMQRAQGAPNIVVDGGAGWSDPSQLATAMIAVDGALLCERLADALGAGRGAGEWAERWQKVERQTLATIEQQVDGFDDLFEGKVFRELGAALPDGAVVFAGNSMPIRDMDTFFPASGRDIRLMANRGANGIDGVVSSALGASAAGASPLVLVIGDLSLYHDSNGLLAAKLHELNATIILLNNDGGGIFSFLSQASEAPEHFEQLFGTPHGLDFRHMAALYGARFHSVADWGEFRQRLAESTGGSGLSIIELRTDRERNVAMHREIWRAISGDLARG